MKTVGISPLDTLLFRDTRPFQGDAEGLTVAKSQFPPLPSVTAGAIRAAIARCYGWSGSGNWLKADVEPEQRLVLNSLGDGPFDTGQWRFGPPLIIEIWEGGFQQLFPCPAHLLYAGAGSAVKFALGTPKTDAESKIRTDLGLGVFDGIERFAIARQPNPLDYKSALGSYLTASDFHKVLKGEIPSGIIPADAIAQQQERAGIALDAERRTARNAMLYVATQMRLRETADAHIGLSVTVGHVESAGAANLYESALDLLGSGVMPLGGGGRGASTTILSDPGNVEVHPRELKDDEFALVFVSPVLLTPDDLRLGGKPFGIDGASVFSVSTGAPMLHGPWDFGAQQRAAGCFALQAGTVVFLKGEVEVFAQNARSATDSLPGHMALGAHANVGFGACYLAAWPN